MQTTTYYIACRYSLRDAQEVVLAKTLPKSHRSVRDAHEFLPLTPAMFHILLALADRERHGYDIMREVDQRTEGDVRLGPGTLYGSIKRMLSDGLVEECDERPDPELDDERRRYYRLTDFRYRVAKAEAERLARLVKASVAKKLLDARHA